MSQFAPGKFLEPYEHWIDRLAKEHPLVGWPVVVISVFTVLAFYGSIFHFVIMALGGYYHE